jgi:imidazolonepropionase-like amidohydrolase
MRKTTVKNRLLALLLIGVAALWMHGIGMAQGSGPVTAFKNVRVFDGERVISECTVIVEGERIGAVGVGATIPEGAEVLDGRGLTLLPGFFDAHVHIWHVDNLKQSAIFGVTTVVDMFMDVKTMTGIKKMQEAGRARDMAYLVSPGILATSPGGHGTQFGFPIPTLSEPGDAGPWVEERVKEGSDFIKIIWDDGSAYNMTWTTLDVTTVAAIIQAAHDQGKIVIIHAATLKQCRQAIAAGVDGLAHLFFENASDPDFGRLVARKGAFVIPTLAVLESMHGVSDPESMIKDPGLSPYIKPDDVQMLSMAFPLTTEKGAYRAAERAIAQLVEAEAPILAGTDAPNPGTTFGASLHRELELLVKAGLTPQAALQSATSIPAGIFKLSDRGYIRSGKLADLVLVKGDPTQDIKHTRQIVGVWRAGQRVDRGKYKAAVAKAVEARENQKNALPPENSESGWISDFEGPQIKTEYGAGWSISTDKMIGGKSEAHYELVEGGAQGSGGSLLITGEVSEGAQSLWAGAFFSPGKAMMQPANLSAQNAIQFWAKGDGKTYSVMIFAQSLGYVPAMLEFKAGEEWQEFTFSFQEFGVEGFDIQGIFIGGSPETGPFRLQIDNVRLIALRLTHPIDTDLDRFN